MKLKTIALLFLTITIPTQAMFNSAWEFTKNNRYLIGTVAVGYGGYMLWKKYNRTLEPHEPNYQREEDIDETIFRANDILYLYCPGMNANTMQAGKYTREFKHEPTQETISSKNGMQVLGGTIYTTKGNEVIHKNLNTPYSWNPCNWPLYAWQEICYKISHMAYAKYGISVKKIDQNSNNLAESTVGHYSINPFAVCIGTGLDKESVIETFKTMCIEQPKRDIILYAVSRGTSALMHALPELMKFDNFKRVKAIILEGAFDSMKHLYEARFWYLAKIMPFKTANWCMSWVIADQSNNNPCDDLCYALKHRNLNVPILIVSSKCDKEVPYECTKNLYESAKKYDDMYGNIEFVELENSRHPNYMFDDKDDREKYLKAVHAFYKKHKLPCIEKYLVKDKE
jgi:hypothetical protein